MRKIRKVVFPVAGIGSRFLPATKASPKEMLPIVDKPLIQYAVEEALAAGMSEMIFVTGRSKRAIADHFDIAPELELALDQRGRRDLLRILHEIIPSHVSCVYVRQPVQLGLGHATLCAMPVVGDEPFAVVLADDLIDGSPPVLRQMVDLYEQHGGSIVAVQKVAPLDTSRYGIVKIGAGSRSLHRMTGIVEKPRRALAPSNLGVVGRYILTPKIFGYLRSASPGAGSEIQLTDGIAALLQQEDVYAYEFSGTRYDCGTKLDYMRANLVYGVRHPEVGRDFRKYLQDFASRLNNLPQCRRTDGESIF